MGLWAQIIVYNIRCKHYLKRTQAPTRRCIQTYAYIHIYTWSLAFRTSTWTHTQRILTLSKKHTLTHTYVHIQIQHYRSTNTKTRIQSRTYGQTHERTHTHTPTSRSTFNIRIRKLHEYKYIHTIFAENTAFAEDSYFWESGAFFFFFLVVQRLSCVIEGRALSIEHSSFDRNLVCLDREKGSFDQIQRILRDVVGLYSDTPHCNTMQHTATHYNSLQHAATHHVLPGVVRLLGDKPHCNSFQHTATPHCNTTLQPTATHCNSLQHTASLCNSLQPARYGEALWAHVSPQLTATHGNPLQLTATRCNTLQMSATRCNALKHTATQRFPPDMVGLYGDTPLHAAASNGHAEIVDYLLNSQVLTQIPVTGLFARSVV